MSIRGNFKYLAGFSLCFLFVLTLANPIGASHDPGSPPPVVMDGTLGGAGFPAGAPDPGFLKSGGALDNTFGRSGIVTTSFYDHSSYGNKVVVQPDGKIIVAGTRGDKSGGNSSTLEDFILVRYLGNGSLDPGFGQNGRVITSIGRHDWFGDMAIQSDGKIVITGISCIYSLQPCLISLVRYLPNGSLDPTFGVNGKLREKYAGTLSTYADRHTSAGIAIQTDGKIVITGSLSNAYGGAVDYGRDIFIFRYNPDGTRDSTFGVDGRLIIDYGNKDLDAGDLVIQEDGRMVFGGNMDSLFLLLRYNLDGTLDATFGNNGKVTTLIAKGALLNGLAIQADKKIVAVGITFDPTTWEGKPVITRYNSNGSLDAGFNYDGKLVLNLYPGFSEWTVDLALQPDGRIVLAGAAEVPCGSGGYNNDLLIARITSTGFLDGTFNGKGWLALNLNSYAFFESASSVAIQPDRKILVLGGTENIYPVIALVRLLP